MGRGVDYVSGAIHVAYFPIIIGITSCEEGGCCSSDFNYWEWDEFVDDLQEIIIDKYTMFRRCDKWDGREKRRILENEFARIVVCRYREMVSVSLAVIDDLCYYSGSDLTPLGENWCHQITKNFQKLIDANFDTHVKIGTMSNGVSVFEKVEK